jgi:cation transport ATPase
MIEKEREQLERQINELQRQKMDLEHQIQELDLEKLNKIETLKNDLERQVEWLDKDKIKLTKERDNLIRKIRISNEKKWKNALKMITLLIILDLVIIPLVIFVMGFPIYWFFISLGLVTFFGMVVVVNYMSGTAPLNTGEVRKALTVAFIAVYFAMMPLMVFGGVQYLPGQPVTILVESFTALMAIIIGFYFGTRAIEKYVKAKKNSKP